MPTPRAPTVADDVEIPFATPTNWVRAATLCGFNVEPVFRELGIATRLSGGALPTVPAGTYRRLMQICVVEARRSGRHFPFVLGETFGFETVAEIETYLATSSTLREALRVFQWVPVLLNPQQRTTLIEEGDLARLVISDAFLDEASHIWFSEARFMAVVKFGRMLMGDPVPLVALCFTHPAPAYAADYERVYGVPCEFGQAEDAIVIRRELLDAPLKGAFPSLHQQAEWRVEQRLAELPLAGSSGQALVARIEQAVQAEPALLADRLDGLAHRLGLHPRTLQRRLREQGHSWSDIQDRVRLRLASVWLRETDWTIEDISTRLGYNDRRCFTQAFGRWTGQTPSAWRRGAGR